ncbi:MAG TPA: MFS transporter [Anaerolineaceae bacterium]|nr:MFS transporter [Anaerolineaceae bacterium]
MDNLLETPPELQSADVVKANFRNVQIDAIGVGLANAASPFLPVYLTHLNATSFQVGLLSSMPAFTGLLLALPLARFLQRQTNIVKWFSIARLIVIASYALTGIISFFLPQTFLVNSILLIWALATLPQTIVAIAFSVVMNAVAGPNRRFELMSRRWSTMGVTTTLMVIGVGQLLDKVLFPLNYQLMFIGLSIGGLISYYYSSHLKLPETVHPPMTSTKSLIVQWRELKELVFKEKPFLSFMIKRFIFMSGVTLAAPLVPLYLVRYVHASDQWISIITTSQTAILVIGYFFWTRLGRRKGTRAVLVWTTLGISLYPFLLALTTSTWQIAVVAGIAGIFQAGLDLVFFDELMKVVPIEYSAIFVGLAQSVQYLAAIASPLIGTFIADQFSLPVGLFVAAGLRFLGFFLFLIGKKPPKRVQIPA